MDKIGIDNFSGSCHKVIITFSGGDGNENPLDLTDYLKETVPFKEVYNSIKKCINPSIYQMAKYNIQNEMKDVANNYPASLDHKYPIKVLRNEKELHVSLVLLDDIPGNIQVSNGLFNMCNLKKPIAVADKAISKIKLFKGEKKNINYEIKENTAVTSIEYTYAVDDIGEYGDDIIYDKKLGTTVFDINKMRIAFISFANTPRGEEILSKISNESSAYCQTTECEQRVFHIEYSTNSAGIGQQLSWIGRGRFNGTVGYMPGGVILAHEIGHTIFGGKYGDYSNGPANSTQNNNLEVNENPMRKAYGMSPREFYAVFKTADKSLRGCYNPKGIKVSCPAIHVLYTSGQGSGQTSDKTKQTPFKWKK